MPNHPHHFEIVPAEGTLMLVLRLEFGHQHVDDGEHGVRNQVSLQSSPNAFDGRMHFPVAAGTTCRDGMIDWDPLWSRGGGGRCNTIRWR